MIARTDTALQTDTANHILLNDISWDAYEKILAALEDRRFPHTYVNGTLEIMTLSQEHEWLKKLLARFIENLSLELQIRMTSSGSATLRGQLKERGLEPDESYYITNYAAIRGLKRIDLNRHPPPDLVVEIDVSRKLYSRLEAYAQLGVPEIWQHDKRGVHFLQRDSETSYRKIEQSLAFPQVKRTDIQRFLKLREKLDEFDLINQFIAWARKLAANQA